MPYQCISVEDAKALISSNDVTLVDIRDAQSFALANVENSQNISNTNVDGFLSTVDTEKPIIVICYHGNSSKGAAEYFFNQGCKLVHSLDGGFEAWQNKR